MDSSTGSLWLWAQKIILKEIKAYMNAFDSVQEGSQVV